MANGTETFTREDGIVICGTNSLGSNGTSKINSTEGAKESSFSKLKKFWHLYMEEQYSLFIL